SGSVVEHVFLDGGTFPIRCTFRIGGNSDSQTTKFIVSRNYERLNSQPDNAQDQAKFVARYDFAKLPPDQLPHAVLLLVQSNDVDSALAAAGTLARAKSHPTKNRAIEALVAAEKLAFASGKFAEIAKLWD